MMRGEVAIAGRVGRERLWDVPERVYPADVVVPSVDEAAPGQERAAARLARHRPAEDDDDADRAGRRRRGRRAGRGRGHEGRVARRPRRARRGLRRADGAAVAVRPARLRPDAAPRSCSTSSTRSRCTSPPPSAAGATSPCPILHDDRLVGKVDAMADRKASVLRVQRDPRGREVHAGDDKGRAAPSWRTWPRGSVSIRSSRPRRKP